ncbi:MAG: hypothetical protein B6U86_03155 [Candidatus Altiarchaeales archaeon ex4484_43]|nr:MAG: hypothetical protein B6U86_03155 [Candidatus Altiarchaeales archaeon ex4484_43]
MILVTGATGRVGGYLISSLISKNEEVRVLARRTSGLYPLKDNVDVVYGDIVDKRSLRNAVKDVSVIYHLAAVVDYLTPKREMYSVNVAGTKNLLDVSLNEDIEHFIYCSSVAVMGNIENPPANEEYVCHPFGNYGKSKYEGEKISLDYYKKENLPVTIIRPAIVYGVGFYDSFDKVLPILKNRMIPIIPVIGSGKNLIHFVHVKDVVKALILAAKERKSVGEVYIIAGNEVHTLESVLDIAVEIMKVKKPKVHIPISLAKLVVMMEKSKLIFGMKPEFTGEHIDNLVMDMAYDITKAKKELGYKPEIDLKSGISEIVNWLNLI